MEIAKTLEIEIPEHQVVVNFNSDEEALLFEYFLQGSIFKKAFEAYKKELNAR